jgi:mannosyltransferase
MINIDGIIYALQPEGGGISGYTTRLIRYLQGRDAGFQARVYGYHPFNEGETNVSAHETRYYERIRKASVDPEATVFWSSYYRSPERDIPSVVTVHDMIAERSSVTLRRIAARIQKWKAIYEAAHIVCISEATKRELIKTRAIRSGVEVSVIRHGVGPEFYVDGCINREDNLALFVGGRQGYKNFTNTVRALANLPLIKLVCIGGGSATPAERSIVDQLLPGRCDFLGSVTQAQLNELYNRASVLLYTSTYEGFGLPILEGFAAGCPVLVCKGEAVCEVAGSAAFVARDGSAEAIRTELVRLLNDRTLREEKVCAGRERAARLNWQSSFSAMLSILEATRR